MSEGPDAGSADGMGVGDAVTYRGMHVGVGVVGTRDGDGDGDTVSVTSSTEGKGIDVGVGDDTVGVAEGVAAATAMNNR